MKHTIITLAITIVAAVAMTPAAAQKDYKFGKVTKAELLRTDFPDIADGAKMIVLDEYIEANLRNTVEWYNSVSSSLGYSVYIRTIDFYDTKKVKIIEPAASGDTEISFTLTSNEKLVSGQVKAIHYSLHNNSLVKHHYSAKDIKQTDLADKSTRYSFIIPATRAGDVFEFTYSKRIDLSDAESYDLTLQQDIPVLDIRCDLASPRKDDDIDMLNDFYKSFFRIGKYQISKLTSAGMKPYTKHVRIYNNGARLSNNKYEVILSDIFTYEATDLPAITDEQDGEIANIRIIFNAVTRDDDGWPTTR